MPAVIKAVSAFTVLGDRGRCHAAEHHDERGGVSVDRIAFGPPINQGQQDIELTLVSQAVLQPRFITGGWRPKSASRPS